MGEKARQDDDMDDVQKALHEKISNAKIDDEVTKRIEARMKSYGSVNKDADGGAEEGLDQQAHAAVRAIVRILTPWKDKLSPTLIHEVLDDAGFKLEGGEGGEEKEGRFMAIPAKINWVEEQGINKAHMGEAVDAAEKAYCEHMEKLGYEKYPAVQPVLTNKDGSPVMKTKGEPVSKSASGGAPDLSGFDPKTRERLEPVLKRATDIIEEQNGQIKELVQKNADLAKRLDDRDAADRKKELVAKAANWKNLMMPQDDVVLQLELADKAGKETFERICKSFDAQNVAAGKSNLFRAVGSDLGGGPSDPEQKLQAMADALVQKSSGGMTAEQAYEKALNSPEGQQLYAEMKAGRKDGI